MPIIAIASDSPELGRKVAEGTAAGLGYRLLGREILAGLAREAKVKEEELVKALDEPPAFLGMRSRRRRELLTRIEAAVLEKLMDDGVVCHGLAAHLYLPGVSHALRVRVLADPASRATGLAGGRGIAPLKAAKLLERLDQDRRRWSKEFFGLDETDPSIYDMVLSLATLEEAKAVEIITDAAGYRKFQPMTYSRKVLNDKLLAARVRRMLLPRFPDVRVQASDGTVVAQVQSMGRDQKKKRAEVRELVDQVPGVSYVEVHVIRDYFGQAATSGR